MLAALEGALPAAGGEADWREAPLRELCAHIVGRHHEYLREHMAKEERVLFPACAALDEGVAATLRRLRDLTGANEPPLDGCSSYRAMLDRLSTLEADTHLHVHKENNVLFPLAAALETARS